MKNPQEKIFDAFLDEALNDTRPPNRAAEILQKLNELSHAAPLANPKSELAPAPLLDVVTDPLTSDHLTATMPEFELVSPASQPGGSAVDSKIDSKNWVSILSTAAVLIIAVGVIVWLLRPPAQIADNDNGENGATVQPGVPFVVNDQQPTALDSIPDINPPRELPDRVNPRDRVANGRFAPGQEIPVVGNLPDEIRPRVAQRNDVPVDQKKLVLPGPYQRIEFTPVAVKTVVQSVAEIDNSLQQIWQDQGISPADQLPVRQWAVRLCSRLIGRAPSAEEQSMINEAMADRQDSAELRLELVQLITVSDTFRSAFVDHWAKTLAWKWIGLSPILQTNDIDIQRTRDYLSEAIGNNQAIDEVVYNLLSAVGSNNAERDDFNPASSYLVSVAKRFGSRQGGYAHIGQSMLGLQSKCAKCHDAASDARLTQREYWEFQSFFAQTRFESAGDKHQYYVVNKNYLPLGQQGKTEAPLTYTDPFGNDQTALPGFASTELGPNGFVAKVDRRSELAKLVAGSSQFRETLVDQIWASLLNVPLTGIDGHLSPKEESLIQLRTILADQLAANDYDLQWLVTTIALSQPFAAGAGTEKQVTDDNPYLGQAPLFSRFYHRIDNQRSPVLSLAIVANAYGSGKSDEALAVGLMARVTGLSFDKKPNTIQPFLPSNDNQWATDSQISRQLDLIASSKKLNDRQKIEHVVLAALGRPASAAEIEQAEIILKNGQSEIAALQDIWWSLLNSFEFELPLNVR